MKISRRKFLAIAGLAAAGAGAAYFAERELSTVLAPNVTDTTANVSLPSKKFVEIKAFENSSFTASPLFTANSLLSLVQGIHAAVGDYNITKFIRAQCQANIDPKSTFSDWNGTLDSYVTAIQQACGGVIIPDGDMDPYFGAGDCLGQVKGQANESQFFQNTEQLLGLSAIRKSGMLHLESWDAWFNVEKDVNNAPLTQSEVDALFGTLENQGYSSFISQSNDGGVNGGSNGGSFTDHDYGHASYVRVGLFKIQNSSPYLIPMQRLINSILQEEPYLKGVLSAIESQQQDGQYGGYDYAIQQF